MKDLSFYNAAWIINAADTADAAFGMNAVSAEKEKRRAKRGIALENGSRFLLIRGHFEAVGKPLKSSVSKLTCLLSLHKK